NAFDCHVGVHIPRQSFKELLHSVVAIKGPAPGQPWGVSDPNVGREETEERCVIPGLKRLVEPKDGQSISRGHGRRRCAWPVPRGREGLSVICQAGVASGATDRNELWSTQQQADCRSRLKFAELPGRGWMSHEPRCCVSVSKGHAPPESLRPVAY